MMLQAQPIDVGGLLDDIKSTVKDAKGALKGAKDAAKSGQLVATNMAETSAKLPHLVQTADTAVKVIAACAVGSLALVVFVVLRRPHRRGV